MGKIIRYFIASVLIFIAILILVDRITGKHTLWSIIRGKSATVTNGSGNTIRYENGENYKVGDGYVDGKAIKHIEINWISGEITLEEGSGNQITFEEKNSSATKDDDKLHWYQKGDTLYLQWCRSGIHSFAKSKNLSIKFPSGLKLDELDINAVSADVNAKGLDVKAINTSTISSRVRFRDVLFTTLDANSVSGDYILEVLNRPSSIDFKGVSGKLDLKIPKDTGFTVDLSTISGAIKTKVPTTGDKKHQTAGNGEVKITFESVSGDIEISY